MHSKKQINKMLQAVMRYTSGYSEGISTYSVYLVPVREKRQTVEEKQEVQLFRNVQIQTDKPQTGNQQIKDTGQKRAVVMNVVV